MITAILAGLKTAKGISVIIIVVLIVITIITLSIIISSQKKNIKTLEGNVATHELAKETQDKTIEHLEYKLKESQRIRNKLMRNWETVSNDYDNAVAKIKYYKGRLDNVAIQNPEKATNIVNNIMSDIMREFYKTTGGENSTVEQ